jgi:hypothetical protein
VVVSEGKNKPLVVYETFKKIHALPKEVVERMWLKDAAE